MLLKAETQQFMKEPPAKKQFAPRNNFRPDVIFSKGYTSNSSTSCEVDVGPGKYSFAFCSY